MVDGKEIRARVIIEVVGTPKPHVEETLSKLLESMKNEEGIGILKKEIFEAQEIEEMKLFSTFIEADIVFKNIEKFLGFCFDYTPSSVEVIEPHSFLLDARFFNAMLNDMITKLHKYTTLIRNLDAEYGLLKKDIEDKK